MSDDAASAPPPIPEASAPPFNLKTASMLVRRQEDLWNSRDPAKVAEAFTPDVQWHERGVILRGRKEIVSMLARKWMKERESRTIHELWIFAGNRIAFRTACEWFDDSAGQWVRSLGNVTWETSSDGLVRWHVACVSDVPIRELDRKLRWTAGPRPEGHPGLAELGL